jgi:hypothetical protein
MSWLSAARISLLTKLQVANRPKPPFIISNSAPTTSLLQRTKMGMRMRNKKKERCQTIIKQAETAIIPLIKKKFL